jgi:hypothetical protein
MRAAILILGVMLMPSPANSQQQWQEEMSALSSAMRQQPQGAPVALPPGVATERPAPPPELPPEEQAYLNDMIRRLRDGRQFIPFPTWQQQQGKYPTEDFDRALRSATSPGLPPRPRR